MQNSVDNQPKDGGNLWLFIMLLVSLVYLMTNIQKTIVPGCLFDILQADFNAKPSQIAAFSSVLMIAYAVMQLLLGPLTARFTPFAITLWGTPFLCVGAIALPLFHQLLPVYICRVLIAIGCSCVTISIIIGTVRVFPQSHTMKIAVFMLIGYAGNVLGGAPALHAAKALGWRNLLEILAIATLLLYLLWAILLRWKAPKEKPSDAPKGSLLDFSVYLKVLKNHQNIWLYCNTPISYGACFCYAVVFGPKFLQDFCNLNGNQAGIVASAVQFIGCISGVVFAAINRKLGGNSTAFLQKFSATTFFVCQGLITIGVFLGIHSPILYAAAFIIISAISNIAAIGICLLTRHNPENLLGAAFSVLNFISYALVSLFGYLCGFIMNCFTPDTSTGVQIYGREAYLTIFVFFCVLAIPVILATYRLKEFPDHKN